MKNSHDSIKKHPQTIKNRKIRGKFPESDISALRIWDSGTRITIKPCFGSFPMREVKTSVS